MFPLRRPAHNLYRSRAFFLFAVLSLTAVALLLTTFAQETRSPGTSPVQQRAQPLDPLTAEETELAARIASADPRVKEALGSGRQQLIQVQFLALKPNTYPKTGQEPEQLKIGRHAAVIFYRYDADQGIHVVVDLEKSSVNEITKLEGKAVPLGFTEVTEAFNLALRNEQVRSFLGSRANDFRVARLSAGERPENRVEGLRVLATSPRDPCYKHRCLDLLFRQRDGYIAGTSVTVDLTAQTVRVERTVR